MCKSCRRLCMCRLELMESAPKLWICCLSPVCVCVCVCVMQSICMRSQSGSKLANLAGQFESSASMRAAKMSLSHTVGLDDAFNTCSQFYDIHNFTTCLSGSCSSSSLRRRHCCCRPCCLSSGDAPDSPAAASQLSWAQARFIGCAIERARAAVNCATEERVPACARAWAHLCSA